MRLRRGAALACAGLLACAPETTGRDPAFGWLTDAGGDEASTGSEAGADEGEGEISSEGESSSEGEGSDESSSEDSSESEGEGEGESGGESADESEGEPAGCPSVLPGTRVARDDSQTDFAQLYAENVDADPGNDVAWPGMWGVSGVPQRLFVARDHYKALRFDTSTAAPDQLRGRFEWGESGVGGVPTHATFTLSTTCGEFEAVDPLCRRYSPGNRIPWHLPGASNVELGSCPLTPGQVYYVNVVYADWSGDLSESTCNFDTCNHLINAGGGPPAFP